MRTTASDVALHGRHLNEVSASTVGEFIAAVGNSAVDKILLAAGTYELTSAPSWRFASTAPWPSKRGCLELWCSTPWEGGGYFTYSLAGRLT